MLSVAFGAAALIALRSFVSAARWSFGATARYSSTVLAGAPFAGAFFTAGFLVVLVGMANHLPQMSLLRTFRKVVFAVAIECEHDPAHALDAPARPAGLSLMGVEPRCGVHLQHSAPLRRRI